MNASHLVAESVWKTIESTHSVTEEQLSILNFLFGKNFERATRIVDQRGVKKISGEPSGRSIFQVVGESRKKEEYFCFAENFCACYSFFYDTVNKGEQLFVRSCFSFFFSHFSFFFLLILLLLTFFLKLFVGSSVSIN
ncbi:hypothetical protein DITRI_Ditri01bG0071200 [Diplodiscus trichospermus]